jgi:hypothetical protein
LLGFHKDACNTSSSELGSDGYKDDDDYDDDEDLLSDDGEVMADDVNNSTKLEAICIPISTHKKPDLPHENTNDSTIQEDVLEENMDNFATVGNADVALLAKELQIPIYFSSKEDAKKQVCQMQINCQRTFYIVMSDSQLLHFKYKQEGSPLLSVYLQP